MFKDCTVGVLEDWTIGVLECYWRVVVLEYLAYGMIVELEDWRIGGLE